MLFKKALRRDLSNLAGVVFATLFTIMVTTTLIRLLGRAAGGAIDGKSLLPLIAFTAINFLPILLVLTLYVAVLMSLTRAYRDSEMVIWFASGRSVADWIRPVLGFATPFVLVIALLAFVVAPWANRQSSQYQQRYEQREDVASVAPGQFRESTTANRVFYVESVSDDQTTVKNVFVTQTQGENLTIVVSSGGRIETEPNGDRFLVLERGRRYDGTIARPEYRVMEFERYGIRLEPKANAVNDESARVKSTPDLLADFTPRNQGELLWRIGLPVSAALLALLAIPLSAFNPRAGRSVNLIVALLTYVVYNNLISVAQAWVAQERMPFAVGVWSVHLALGLLIAALFYRRLAMRWLPAGLRFARRHAA